jgi:hypothetical protein
MVLMVGYQKVKRGKRAELDTLNERWRAFDERLGMPPEKQYACFTGGHEMGTLLLIREWDSLEAMEAGFAKMQADPELAELSAEAEELVESTQWELYYPSS